MGKVLSDIPSQVATLPVGSSSTHRSVQRAQQQEVVRDDSRQQRRAVTVLQQLGAQQGVIACRVGGVGRCVMDLHVCDSALAQHLTAVQQPRGGLTIPALR